MEFDGFDWDSGNWPKCGKHGVAKAEIEAMFANALRVFPDPVHSAEVQRFLAIGQNEAGRYIFAAFTIRHRAAEVLIRPISARYMHEREVKRL